MSNEYGKILFHRGGVGSLCNILKIVRPGALTIDFNSARPQAAEEKFGILVLCPRHLSDCVLGFFEDTEEDLRQWAMLPKNGLKASV